MNPDKAPQQAPPEMPPDLPSLYEQDRLRYQTRDGTYLSQFVSQPLVTTLTSFSHVANFVKNPYEIINNVDEFVRQASGQNRRQRSQPDDDAINIFNRHLSLPNSSRSPIAQEMDTFVADSADTNNRNLSPADQEDRESQVEPQLPIPALPPIECSSKRGRLKPLTIEEYEKSYRLGATDLEIVERVFFGGMACNQLRVALWPYIFGLIKQRGSFKRIDGDKFEFIEHPDNSEQWQELNSTYEMYRAQWKSIIPDQETRFSTFRERKSLIERDVIRCDRLHPFYAEIPQNLVSLTDLLMTYMMYDFDIGYVQGMSDLAGPILYMYDGDVVKSFWVFVEVMKLFRRNFEYTQKTVHFQLSCLHELIKATDPIFAQYLSEYESSNCFFAFRAIVCQFKRELMKEDEDDYSNVLYLWDTIWCVKRRYDLLEEKKAISGDTKTQNYACETNAELMNVESGARNQLVEEQPSVPNHSIFFSPFDPNQSDSPRHVLTETEIFVLSLCLSMIRRERDLVLANKLDATEIHLHFIDPKLKSDLNGFIEHAINIYSYLKSDFDLTRLSSPKSGQTQPKQQCSNDRDIGSPPGSAEGYDLLNDFLIINGTSD